MSDNNWIEWNGGECPVPEGTLVDVKFRCGNYEFGAYAWGRKDDSGGHASSKAGPAFWDNDGMDFDIIAYRLHQPEQAGWNGEGLPPVGTECELVNFYGEDFPYFVGESGETVKIIGNGFTNSYPVAFYEADGDLGNTLSYAVAECFRPIRTEAERKRDDFTDACIDLDSSVEWSHSTDYFGGLYDAIAAGKIPGVKLL